MCIRDSVWIARRDRERGRPSPRLGIHRNWSPGFSEAGAGGAGAHNADLASGVRTWNGPPQSWSPELLRA
eukprot:4208746-Alexandrium_andersonii.AAC.1